jgi:hypothetical protein
MMPITARIAIAAATPISTLRWDGPAPADSSAVSFMEFLAWHFCLPRF